MRALLATTGSDGDIRPFFALGIELIARGHEVLFAAPDHYAGAAEGHGIPFRKIGPPWVPEEMAKTFARVLALASPLAQLVEVMDAVTQPELEAVPELLEMVSQVDVVIYPPLLVAAAAAARAKNVRHISVQLAPVHRARNYGPTGVNMGALLNGILWTLAGGVLRRATDAKLNTIVLAAGLSPWKNVLLEAASSSWLDLIAASPSVFERDPGWPSVSRLTGYWFLDEPDFEVDPALEEFVRDDRPVVIGFGSMNGFDPHVTTRMILEAVRGSKRKVVVQAGWAGLGQADLPKHVHVTRFVPHAWLFARAACVVHHGGAGTTAAALRAGIPQAIVWHVGDQPMGGQKVQSLGVGPAPVSHKKVSAGWIRRQIESMSSDGEMQKIASALGTKIRAENGVTAAASLIEEAVAEARSQA